VVTYSYSWAATVSSTQIEANKWPPSHIAAHFLFSLSYYIYSAHFIFVYKKSRGQPLYKSSPVTGNCYIYIYIWDLRLMGYRAVLSIHAGLLTQYSLRPQMDVCVCIKRVALCNDLVKADTKVALATHHMWWQSSNILHYIISEDYIIWFKLCRFFSMCDVGHDAAGPHHLLYKYLTSR
jgi:hypothetical protein